MASRALTRTTSLLARGRTSTIPKRVTGHFARSKSTAAVTDGDNGVAAPSTFVSTMVSRWQTSLEITVSKIFPAGFGWQGASVLADNAGLSSDSLGFFMATGAGDFAGVFIGHTLFYTAKRALVDKSINMAQEAQAAVLLASAAFGSGFVWQLALNNFQAVSLPFTACALGTGAVCGATFYGGLRLGRQVFPKLGLNHIEGPTYKNLRDDAALSTAIGGATGMFVGTDVSFAADNFLRGFVGIEDTASTLTGMAIAGKSTAAGYMAVQGAMNVFLPTGRNWLDGELRE